MARPHDGHSATDCDEKASVLSTVGGQESNRLAVENARFFSVDLSTLEGASSRIHNAAVASRNTGARSLLVNT